MSTVAGEVAAGEVAAGEVATGEVARDEVTRDEVVAGEVAAGGVVAIEVEDKMFYDNKKAGGLDMYRPVAKIGGKESEDAIADAMNRFFLETADLEDTVVVLDSGKSVNFHHVVLPTMLDGKCRFVLFNFE